MILLYGVAGQKLSKSTISWELSSFWATHRLKINLKNHFYVARAWSLCLKFVRAVVSALKLKSSPILRVSVEASSFGASLVFLDFMRSIIFICWNLMKLFLNECCISCRLQIQSCPLDIYRGGMQFYLAKKCKLRFDEFRAFKVVFSWADKQAADSAPITSVCKKLGSRP